MGQASRFRRISVVSEQGGDGIGNGEGPGRDGGVPPVTGGRRRGGTSAVGRGDGGEGRAVGDGGTGRTDDNGGTPERIPPFGGWP